MHQDINPPLATTWCVYRPVANASMKRQCVCVSCHDTLNAPTIEISEMCYLMVLLVNFALDGLSRQERDATHLRNVRCSQARLHWSKAEVENRPKKQECQHNAFFDQIHEFMRQPGLNRKCIVCYFGWRKCRVNGQIIIGVMAELPQELQRRASVPKVQGMHTQSSVNFGRCHSLNTRTTINFFHLFFYVLFFVYCVAYNTCIYTSLLQRNCDLIVYRHNFSLLLSSIYPTIVWIYILYIYAV